VFSTRERITHSRSIPRPSQRLIGTCAVVVVSLSPPPLTTTLSTSTSTSTSVCCLRTIPVVSTLHLSTRTHRSSRAAAVDIAAGGDSRLASATHHRRGEALALYVRAPGGEVARRRKSGTPPLCSGARDRPTDRPTVLSPTHHQPTPDALLSLQLTARERSRFPLGRVRVQRTSRGSRYPVFNPGNELRGELLTLVSCPPLPLLIGRPSIDPPFPAYSISAFLSPRARERPGLSFSRSRSSFLLPPILSLSPSLRSRTLSTWA